MICTVGDVGERRDNEFFARWVQSPRACAPNSCFERIPWWSTRLLVPGATDRSGAALLAVDFCPSAHNGSHLALAHGAKCELPCAGGYSTPTGFISCDRGNLSITPCVPKQCLPLEDTADGLVQFMSSGFAEMRYAPTDTDGRPVHGSIGRAVCAPGKQPTDENPGAACNATDEGIGTYKFAEVIPQDPPLGCEDIPCVGSMEELEDLEGRNVECGGGDAPPPWILGVECKFTAAKGYFFNVSDESDESTGKILSKILSCNVEDGIDTGAPGNVARWPPLPQPQRVLCPPSADFPNCGDALFGDTCEQDENGEPYKCPAGTAKDGDPAEEGKSITLECAVVQGKRAEGLWSSPCADLSCAAGQQPVSNMADCTYGGESFFADGATELMTSGAMCMVACADGFKIFKGGSTGLICVQGQFKGLDSNAEVVERLPNCENALMKFETVHKVEGSVAFAMDAAQVDELLAPSNIE